MLEQIWKKLEQLYAVIYELRCTFIYIILKPQCVNSFLILCSGISYLAGKKIEQENINVNSQVSISSIVFLIFKVYTFESYKILLVVEEWSDFSIRLQLEVGMKPYRFAVGVF